MQDFKSFSERLSFLDKSHFEDLALDLFHFQSIENEVYRSYLSARKVQHDKIKTLDSIPFLPIRFFSKIFR